MLLASGMMDGEVKHNGQRLIIKGSVRKEILTSYEEDDRKSTTIETDTYKITVRAITFDPLEIIEIT